MANGSRAGSQLLFGDIWVAVFHGLKMDFAVAQNEVGVEPAFPKFIFYEKKGFLGSPVFEFIPCRKAERDLHHRPLFQQNRSKKQVFQPIGGSDGAAQGHFLEMAGGKRFAEDVGEIGCQNWSVQWAIPTRFVFQEEPADMGPKFWAGFFC